MQVLMTRLIESNQRHLANTMTTHQKIPISQIMNLRELSSNFLQLLRKILQKHQTFIAFEEKESTSLQENQSRRSQLAMNHLSLEAEPLNLKQESGEVQKRDIFLQHSRHRQMKINYIKDFQVSISSSLFGQGLLRLKEELEFLQHLPLNFQKCKNLKALHTQINFLILIPSLLIKDISLSKT